MFVSLNIDKQLMRYFVAFILILLSMGSYASQHSQGNPTPIPVTPIVTSQPTAVPITPLFTSTRTPTPSLTFTPTASPTPTLTPTPTQPLWTLTPARPANIPTFQHVPASFSANDGWSCGDFPCEDDIAGFLQRIQVPSGYVLSHVGRFPGQPMQIAYDADGRLYGTVITDPVARTGAVYRLMENGEAQQVSPIFVSPVGLAFQPGTDVLYVSGRVSLEQGGAIWRVEEDGQTSVVVGDLPCCFQIIDNQPNGMVFGSDGLLYIGVGSLSDHAEPINPATERNRELVPLEASILRINPHTGEVSVYAEGIRNPYDVTFDSQGQLYATDNGLLSGAGDRVLQVDSGGHYGWPYWRGRGCEECPLPTRAIDIQPDWVRFPDYTLPRGIVAYTGNQFPPNVFDSIFVALWHNTPNAQRIVRIDPATVPTDPELLRTYEPEPFVTGLIRPVDVVVAPDGGLVIADFVYGHVWRVDFAGLEAVGPLPAGFSPVTAEATEAVQPAESSIFVTSTPRP
ncbi:MAG: hypothetical protein CUN56_06170 [Phototrophicales bacterium]|nr:MAG: hypothetical protein CUN56_06170 [Phototrophicales bacterium]RMG74134.1 MAG: hypothetical protein D6711_09720 [Chloroflexota bacterium]